MGKLSNLHYELLEHPPYSPDLAPSDYCFFPEFLPRWSAFFFESRGDCSCRVVFSHLTKYHYRGGIMALEHRWNKCIILKGDYVEK
jgi:histone-lysine N-methyltransferase SETMAR